MSTDENISLLVGIINRLRPELIVNKESIDADTNLLIAGILDSISFLELLLEIEKITDRQLDLGSWPPEALARAGNLAGLLSLPYLKQPTETAAGTK